MPLFEEFEKQVKEAAENPLPGDILSPKISQFGPPRTEEDEPSERATGRTMITIVHE